MYWMLTSSLLLRALLTTALVFPTASKLSKPRFVAPLSKVDNSKLSRRYYGVGQTSKVLNDPEINWVTSVQIGGYTDGFLGNPGETFNPKYFGSGDGNSWLSGSAVLDSVTVAGYQVDRMALGVADSIGSGFADLQYDGIIGFGFQGQNSITPDQSQTFMETALPNLDQPTFAVDLHIDGSGTIELGGVDNSRYSGDLMSLSVDGGMNSWIVDVTFDFGDGFSQQMSFDTGAVATSVDTSIASAYWTQPGLDGAQEITWGSFNGWAYPCGASLPDFNLYSNGQNIALAGDIVAWSAPASDDGSMCQGGVQGVSGTGSMGVMVFEYYYVVFNQAEPSIQLALQLAP